MQTINHAVIAIQSVSLTPAPTLSPGVSPPPRPQKPLPSPGGGPGGDPPAVGRGAGRGTWAEAGSSPGLSGLCTAPNPGWYLCRSPDSIKRGKLFPGLISRPCFNLGARSPVIPPREGAEPSAGKQPVRRDPHPPPQPNLRVPRQCWGEPTTPPKTRGRWALPNPGSPPSPLSSVAVASTPQAPGDAPPSPKSSKTSSPALSYKRHSSGVCPTLPPPPLTPYLPPLVPILRAQKGFFLLPLAPSARLQR